MHCPNCGTEASDAQKFCRACGLSLERFARLLAGPPPDVKDEDNDEDKDVERARLRLRQLESGAKLFGGAVVAIAWLAIASLIGGVGVNMLINTGNIVGGVLLSGMAVGAIAAEGLFIYYAALHAKVAARRPTRPEPEPAEITNDLLPEQQAQIAMSVTERTTARLDEKIESASKSSSESRR